MLAIYEAERLIDQIHDGGFKIDGLLISNWTDTSYGRIYVRTVLHFDGNFMVYPWHKYISYPIKQSSDVRYTTKEIQEMADEALVEQLQDIETLKKKIQEYFPDAPVYVVMSKYFCFDYNNILLSGELVQDVHGDIPNEDLKWEYETTIESINSQREKTEHIKRVLKEEDVTRKKLSKIVREEVKSFQSKRRIN